VHIKDISKQTKGKADINECDWGWGIALNFTKKRIFSTQKEDFSSKSEEVYIVDVILRMQRN